MQKTKVINGVYMIIQEKSKKYKLKHKIFNLKKIYA